MSAHNSKCTACSCCRSRSREHTDLISPPVSSPRWGPTILSAYFPPTELIGALTLLSALHLSECAARARGGGDETLNWSFGGGERSDGGRVSRGELALVSSSELIAQLATRHPAESN